jgi:hypothetical protein
MLAARHHLQEEEIERYSMGSLSEDECDSIENHLLLCEMCQQRVTEHDIYFGAMREACAEHALKSAKKTRWFFQLPFFYRLLPFAAAFSAILLIGFTGIRYLPLRPAVPAASIELQAVRGAPFGAKAPAGAPLSLHLDIAGLPGTAFRAETVDSQGRPVWTGQAIASPGMQEPMATATLHALRPGLYFVRLYAPTGLLLREYGLETTK